MNGQQQQMSRKYTSSHGYANQLRAHQLRHHPARQNPGSASNFPMARKGVLDLDYHP
jgi:hypothetical protein